MIAVSAAVSYIWNVWTYFQRWFLQFDPAFRPMIIATLGMVVPLLAAWLAARALRFNREKHREDRELALRKEIYAGASDVLAESMQTLVRTITPDCTSEDRFAAFRKFNGSLGKILTVSDTETQRVALRMNEQFVDAFHSLENLKGPLSDGLAVLTALKRENEQIFEARTKFGEKAVDVMLSRLPVLELKNALDMIEQRKRYLEQMQLENNVKQGELRKTEFARYCDGMEKTVELMDALHLTYIDLLLAFRRELGIQTDEKWFRCEMEKDARKAKESGLTSVARMRLEMLSD